MTEEFEPNRRVHRAAMFTCHSTGCDIGFVEAPEREIASGLLEEIGEWHRAIGDLESTNVPAGVAETLRDFHDAVCGWVDWLDRRQEESMPKSSPPAPPTANESTKRQTVTLLRP